jgi:putative peptidoglycan lipid II flippase
MARGRQLVWITPVHFDHQGRPVDPDYGVDEGVDPGYGIPGGGRPPHVGNRPPGSWGGFPGHPDQGLPGGGWGGRPVDPGYGVEGGGEAGQLPVFPVDPEHPDQGLPPEVPPGIPELPPGTIWPPLPPSIPAGKAIAVVWISGVGSRYAVIDIPERPVDPGYGVGEEHPDQGLPPTRPRPPTAGQPLPPTGRPPRPGQGLPRPPGAPPRPDQGLPPTAQPKR